MNRRQFLTGVSAAAVASALPAPPAGPILTGIDYGAGDSVSVVQLYWRGRCRWTAGKDNTIHYSDPCDLLTFFPTKALDSPPRL